MKLSPLRLIKHAVEYRTRSECSAVPKQIRGIYVLYKHRPQIQAYDVVYVGLAASESAGVRRRLRSHDKTKGDAWTHFSIFQVWENIRPDEVKELEGLFRHLFRRDSMANKLNKQRSYKRLNQISRKSFDDLK